MTTTRILGIALLLSSATLPLAASAQDRNDEASAEPEHRVDIILPAFGIGYFAVPATSYERAIATVGLDLRYASRSGHGAMLRATYATTLWGSAYGMDVDYLFRARLAGDRHLSLALDFMIGGTVAMLEHNENTLAIGPHVGGNAGVSLDFRVHNFIVALGAQYRLMAGAQAAGDGSTNPEHVLTATLGVGLTFY